MIIQWLFTVSCSQKIVHMMAHPGGKATCVKADTLGLPSDHILNYGVFDLVMELIYLLIKPNISDNISIYIWTSEYILFHSRAYNYIDNCCKWQKLHIWKTHLWTMISTVTNSNQWMFVFKYIPQHLFIFRGVRHLTLMACLWHKFCSWNYTLLSYSDPDPFQLTGKLIWGLLDGTS